MCVNASSAATIRRARRLRTRRVYSSSSWNLEREASILQLYSDGTHGRPSGERVAYALGECIPPLHGTWKEKDQYYSYIVMVHMVDHQAYAHGACIPPLHETWKEKDQYYSYIVTVHMVDHQASASLTHAACVFLFFMEPGKRSINITAI